MSSFHLVGVAGRARAGKDTIGQIMLQLYGFAPFSFSDELYREVSDAYGVDVSWLKDDQVKDREWAALSLDLCSDNGFVEVATKKLDAEMRQSVGQVYLLPGKTELSPRWVLQTWGTEYRRAQDPDYWVNRADERLMQIYSAGAPGAVNVSVRFGNEYDWIRSCGGTLIRVERKATECAEPEHASEHELDGRPFDVTLYNDESLENLRAAVSFVGGFRGWSR